MLTAIIYAHPYDKSFNRAILDAVEEGLRDRNREFALIDLYQENFNPVLSREELEVYSSGGWKDLLVARYNVILDRCGRIILVFPIWWYDFPAILKGFFDKVMLADSAFTSDEKGLHARRNIPHTLIITTSNAPTEALVTKFGDTVNGMMINATFKAIGFNGASWENFGAIGRSTPEERKAFLAKAAALA